MDIPWLAPTAIAGLSAAAASAGLTTWLIRAGARPWQAIDRPNERSLHQSPVPRTGGLAVLAGMAVAAAATGLWFATIGNGATDLSAFEQPLDRTPAALPWIAVALLPLATISYLDDRGHVSRRLRFGVHLLAAGMLWFAGLGWERLDLPGVPLPLPTWIALPATLLFTVWMINLYNFMDGMDGLAGSMAVFGFGALAILGLRGGEPVFAASSAAIAASAAGFLLGNLPPARIFLGDVGAASLGLLAAASMLWGVQLGLFPLWVGILAFSPFVVDATWTLLRRAIASEPLWQAHRSHHYQRLVLAGWSHARTLGRAVVLMAAAAATAIAAPDLGVADQWLLLAAWAAIFLTVHLRVRLVEQADDGADH